MTKTVRNQNLNLNGLTGVMILGELLLTYIGTLFTYELLILFRSGKFTLGIEILQFDFYLAVLTMLIVLMNQGLRTVRTRPDIQNQVSGAFGKKERIIITSITLFVGVDWYMQPGAGGVMLLGTVLFAAILAFSAVISILLLLRWAFLGTGNESEPR